MCVIIIYPKGFGYEVGGLDEVVLDVTPYKHCLYPSCLKKFILEGFCSSNISIFVY